MPNRVLASASWLAADAVWHGVNAVSVWNGFTRFGIYVSMAWLTSRVRIDQRELREMNAKLEELLEHEQCFDAPPLAPDDSDRLLRCGDVLRKGAGDQPDLRTHIAAEQRAAPSRAVANAKAAEAAREPVTPERGFRVRRR